MAHVIGIIIMHLIALMISRPLFIKMERETGAFMANFIAAEISPPENVKTAESGIVMVNVIATTGQRL
jgi:hypothetical protein